MRRCPLSDIPPEAVLGHPVCNGRGMVLLQAGLPLNERRIGYLRAQGVTHVYLETSPAGEPPTPEQERVCADVKERQWRRFGPVEGDPVMTALRDVTVDIKSCGGGQPPAPSQPAEAPAPGREGERAMRARVNDLARRVNELPTLPGVFHEVEALTRDPQVPAARVAQAIGRDPVMSTRLLRVANSARYGLSQPVTTVTRAASVMGQRAVRETVLVTSVLKLLPDDPAARELAGSFWRHSLAVGAAAQALGSHLGWQQAEELFLAGLVHDIGKIFWLHHFPRELAAVLAEAERSGRTMLECETEQLGMNHARLGRTLAKRWRLPAPYGDVIAGHHEPASSAQPRLCWLVHAADVFAHALELDAPSLRRVPRLLPPAAEALALRLEALPALLEMIQVAFQESLDLFPFLSRQGSSGGDPWLETAAPAHAL